MEAAIIGVIGTLLGAVLGWCLNYFSSKGGITIYISSWDVQFKTSSAYGGYAQSSCINGTECIDYLCSVDIYNSSSNTRMIRDIQIVFYEDKRVLLKSVPFDGKTNGKQKPRIVMPINIPPKSAVNSQFQSSIMIIEKEYEDVWKTNRILFEYRNEKNKRKRVLIKEVEFKDYFIELEEQNGQDEDAE